MFDPKVIPNPSKNSTEETPPVYLNGITLDGIFREIDPTPARPLWTKRLLNTVAAIAACTSINVQALSLFGDTIDDALFSPISAVIDTAGTDQGEIAKQDLLPTLGFVTALVVPDAPPPAPMSLVLFAIGLGAITYSSVPERPHQKR
jgi:hypothetical protein